MNEGGGTSALLVEVGDGVGSSELASACSVSGCFGSPYLWVAGSWLSENSEFARLASGRSGIRTFGTSRKEPVSLSLFGGFGPEVSRLCLCDSLPARSVRSQFRRDRICYTEGAPLR